MKKPVSSWQLVGIMAFWIFPIHIWMIRMAWLQVIGRWHFTRDAPDMVIRILRQGLDDPEIQANDNAFTFTKACDIEWRLRRRQKIRNLKNQ